MILNALSFIIGYLFASSQSADSPSDRLRAALTRLLVLFSLVGLLFIILEARRLHR
jgi:hypothetical protein